MSAIIATPSDMHDLGALRLAQAKALIEMIGIAATFSPDTEPPMIDAASGVIALLEQAGEAFRGAQEIVS